MPYALIKGMRNGTVIVRTLSASMNIPRTRNAMFMMRSIR